MGNAATTRPAHDNVEREGGIPEESPSEDVFYRRSSTTSKMTKKKLCEKGCCKGCCGGLWWLKVLYLALAGLISLVALVVIALSVTTAIGTKIYSSDLSGRLVGLICLSISAAGVISVLILGVIAVFKKKIKTFNVVSGVLLTLAFVQVVILGTAVRVTQNDEVVLSRSLIESFRLAREGNPRHLKMWSNTQYALDCCGVYSAEDYRRPGIPIYFPPDVPISCCPSYEHQRSDLVQERNREFCKSRGDYYRDGCKGPVLLAFKESAHWLLGAVIVLFVLEVIEVSVALLIYRKDKKEQDPKPPKKQNPEDGHKPPNPAEKENGKKPPKPAEK